MDNQKLSVIVPAYHIAPWLPRCLDSILAQNVQNLEVIVVDDGSTDDSFAIAKSYAEKDSRVKAVRKENGGVTSARLRGVAEATGDWVGFVDGDDTIEPDMYARLLKNAQEFGADISHCGYRLVFADGRESYFNNSGIQKVQSREEAVRDLLDGSVVGSGLVTKLFRRELFFGLEEKMDFSVRNNEDLLMNFYLFSQAEKAVLEDFCPYNYIVRQGSASRSGYTDAFIYDPMKVQNIILAHCSPENREDVLRSRLRGCINTYCTLSAKGEKGYARQKADIRAAILKQREYMPLLPKRNRLLGEMICSTPGIYGILYPLYCKYLQKNRYE